MLIKFRALRALLGLTLLLGCAPQMPATQQPGGRLRPFDEASKPAQLLAGEAVSQLPAAAPKALTYMSYEATDNDLYPDLDKILKVLEGIGSNPQMNLLAQIDSQGLGNSARYFFRPGRSPELESPYLKLPAAAENSGDPQTLAEAVHWAFSAYPARINWLNISGHGSSFEGISADENPESLMNIVNFTQALHQGLQKGQAAQKLDIISFDACMMAAVEVASELQDDADILVASEDSTTYWGQGYGQTFARLAPNPAAMKPDQVARSLVVDVHGKGPDPYAKNVVFQTGTVSATDLRKMALLEPELDRLARALRRALPGHGAEIVRAALASQDFTLAKMVGGYPYRDLNRLLSLLRQHVRDAEIAGLCDQINHLLYRRGLIMYSRQNRIENGEGRGLSIYLPTDGSFNPLYRQTRFARSTQWDEFLLELNQVLKQQPPRP
ncbi:MAG: clostripain-related cysteine peptidase [Candidatus Sericytochromatia bacterium]